MSSIGSVDVGQGLSQLLQRLSLARPTQSASSTAAVSPANAGNSNTITNQDVQGAHRRNRENSALFSKIDSAVTSALQSAQSNGSSDPNKVVQDAIAKVFKDNNITPPTPSANGRVSASDPDGDGDSHVAGHFGTNDNSAQQSFLQTLQSFGVNAQQFRNDFLTAVKDAQAGQASPSTAFKSFPPGSVVDTTA